MSAELAKQKSPHTNQNTKSKRRSSGIFDTAVLGVNRQRYKFGVPVKLIFLRRCDRCHINIEESMVSGGCGVGAMRNP